MFVTSTHVLVPVRVLITDLNPIGEEILKEKDGYVNRFFFYERLMVKAHIYKTCNSLIKVARWTSKVALRTVFCVC